MTPRNGGDKRWRASRDGPWPWVETQGELSLAEAEWLHTNGAGAYSMSTIALMHTRRYHGVLVAAFDPPMERYVVLSHAEVSVRCGTKTFRLATHQFPNVAPTPGYRLLRRFSQHPIPTWTFRLGDHELEMALCLARGQNTVVLRLIWHGTRPADATIRPLMPMRPMHSLMREHGGMLQRATLRSGEVEIQPMRNLPSVVFRHEGVFVGSPDWWRRFEYLEDRTRAAEFQEDLWTPGMFEMRLDPQQAHYLVVATNNPLPDSSAAEVMEGTIGALLSRDPGPTRRSSVRSLSLAADAFCVTECARPAIIAGYPWYDVHSRDALVSLPGICLSRGEPDKARAVLRTMLDHLRGGFVPEVLPEHGRPGAGPSPGATLWFCEAARQLVSRVGPDDEFVAGPLYSGLVRMFVRFSRGPRSWAWLTSDGLIANGAEGRPLTWMDASVGNRFVTPRSGCAIEWQALWINACETLAGLAEHKGDQRLATECRGFAGRARNAFRQRYWCREKNYAYDCVSEATSGHFAWQDSSIRPNAVIALALHPGLFEPAQATAILDRAGLELVTPRGLRTLGPADGRYQGYHEGGTEQREGSAHQGSTWFHLLGFFVRASVQVLPGDFALQEELTDLVENALDGGPTLGHVTQLADGDAPHTPRGCPAQAWGTAELLRALVDDLRQ